MHNRGLSLLVLCLAQLLGARSQTVYIKGGTVVNADRHFQAHVLVEDGKIIAVGQDVQAPSSAILINATGKLVMPGGIDPHTHLSMPFSGTVACDDFESGQSAALAGGTTMHIDFALPIDGDLEEGLKAWQRKAERSVMDYSFHMAITTWNDKVAKDMEMLVAAGVNSFKFFMAYKGALQVSDEQMIAGFRKCKALGALAQVHAENGDAVEEAQQRTFDAGITGPEGHAISRPAILEGEATGRAIRLAAHVNTPLYVVHVMSREALAEVVSARAAGFRVVGEAVTSGIALTDAGLWDPDFDAAAKFVMSPPIRGAGASAALKGALAGGVLQVIATDHAVFNTTQKRRGRHDFRHIPNGVNGIEERLHVAWEELVNSGLVSASDFVRLVSTSAAQTFGIYPQKVYIWDGLHVFLIEGIIASGSDGDIIVLDPNEEHVISPATHHSRMDTNVYDGKRIRGKVVTTISQGRVVWEHGKLHVLPGTGRFIPRPVFPPLFEGLDRTDAAWLRTEFPYGTTPVVRADDQARSARDEL